MSIHTQRENAKIQFILTNYRTELLKQIAFTLPANLQKSTVKAIDDVYDTAFRRLMRIDDSMDRR